METTLDKNDQKIQLLSLDEDDDREENISYHVRINRSQSFMRRHWKTLVVTPLVICLLFMTYLIATGTMQRMNQTVPSHQSKIHNTSQHLAEVAQAIVNGLHESINDNMKSLDNTGLDVIDEDTDDTENETTEDANDEDNKKEGSTYSDEESVEDDDSDEHDWWKDEETYDKGIKKESVKLLSNNDSSFKHMSGDDVPVSTACSIGLYTLAEKQYRDYFRFGPVEATVDPNELNYVTDIVHTIESTGKHVTMEVDVEEFWDDVKQPNSVGSSFITSVESNHTFGVGLFDYDEGSGRYRACARLPPECAHIMIRLYSYDYIAFRAVTKSDIASGNIVMRTIFDETVCPNSTSITMGMSTRPHDCVDEDVNLQTGAWTQINYNWYWNSHGQECLVPDMIPKWNACGFQVDSFQFLGDFNIHRYAFRIAQLFNERENGFEAHKQSYKFFTTCGELANHFSKLDIPTDKYTIVIMHCGTGTLHGQGYSAFKDEISDLFRQSKLAQRLSRNRLQFVFLLSNLRHSVSQVLSNSQPSQGIGTTNIFSAAVINNWVIGRAKQSGVAVFDDMYPRMAGLGHIDEVDKSLANLLLYQICRIHWQV